jgi:hypothetical protein
VQPTRLLTANDTVDKENKRAFDALVAPEHVFTARDWGEEPYLKFLQKNCMAVEELKLKVGAQVTITTTSGITNTTNTVTTAVITMNTVGDDAS